MNTTNQTSVLTVAKEVLSQATSLDLTLTPLQLMKLTYIAHGVKLAVIEQPMFEEEVEAWRYGPVISRLYQKIKRFGRQPIPSDAIGELDIGQSCDEFDKKIIALVLAKWGKNSGPELSSATHQMDTPWYKIWNREGGKYMGNSSIPNHEIQQHYKELLNFPS